MWTAFHPKKHMENAIKPDCTSYLPSSRIVLCLTNMIEYRLADTCFDFLLTNHMFCLLNKLLRLQLTFVGPRTPSP